MKTIRTTGQYEKDVVRAAKRGKNMTQLDDVVFALASDTPLPARCRPHPLHGFKRMECHVAPDWLLLYELTDTELILRATGSHSDLFD